MISGGGSKGENPVDLFGEDRIANKQNDKCEGQSSFLSTTLRNIGTNVPWKRSTTSLACGWNGEVVICSTPSLLHSPRIKDPVNWVPWSDRIRRGKT